MNLIKKRKQNAFNKKEFGARLKQARSQANITSEQLGYDACKVEPAFIRQIESGAKLPSIQTFVHICNNLQISPSYLLEKEILFPNFDTTQSELSKLMLQLSPIFHPIIHEILSSLIENLAEAKEKSIHDIEKKKQFEPKEFGRRLCKVREEMCLTPQQLAVNCGISTSFIHHIESGNRLPSLSVFTNLCKTLQVSPAYLLGNELKDKIIQTNQKEFIQIQYHMTPKAQKITSDIMNILIRNLAKL